MKGEWQPIETAPRDGTHILCAWLYGGWRIGIFKYAPNGQWVSVPGAWSCDVRQWQPLPEPPQ